MLPASAVTAEFGRRRETCRNLIEESIEVIRDYLSSIFVCVLADKNASPSPLTSAASLTASV